MPAPIQLPPARFVWEKYLSKSNFGLPDLLVGDLWASTSWQLAPGVTLVGWSPADVIPIRSRAEGIVVLVEFQGEEIWFHCQTIPKQSGGPS
jgi:hypothetical protein